MTPYLQDVLIVATGGLVFVGMVAGLLLSGAGQEPEWSVASVAPLVQVVAEWDVATWELAPRDPSPSVVAFAQRAAAAPIFAALACELGLGRAMGVCA